MTVAGRPQRALRARASSGIDLGNEPPLDLAAARGGCRPPRGQPALARGQRADRDRRRRSSAPPSTSRSRARRSSAPPERAAIRAPQAASPTTRPRAAPARATAGPLRDDRRGEAGLQGADDDPGRRPGGHQGPPFVRVATNLSLTTGTYASDLPPFNPLRFFAEEAASATSSRRRRSPTPTSRSVKKDLTPLAVEATAPALSDEDVAAILEEERRLAGAGGAAALGADPGPDDALAACRGPGRSGDTLGYAAIVDARSARSRCGSCRRT